MLTLPLLVSSLALAGASHEVCDAAEFKIQQDPFDGKESRLLSGPGHTLSLVDDGVLFELRFSEAGAQPMTLDAGFEFTFLLENKTKVTFVSDRPAEPSGQVWATQYSAGVSTSWVVTFPVSMEAAHAIAQSPPVATKYQITDGRTNEVGERAGRMYQRDFACIANQHS